MKSPWTLDDEEPIEDKDTSESDSESDKNSDNEDDGPTGNAIYSLLYIYKY